MPVLLEDSKGRLIIAPTSPIYEGHPPFVWYTSIVRIDPFTEETEVLFSGLEPMHPLSLLPAGEFGGSEDRLLLRRVANPSCMETLALPP